MSGEIVLSPVVLPFAIALAPVALGVVAAGAVIGVGKDIIAAREKRLAEERKEQERQLAALASRLDILAKKHVRESEQVYLDDEFLKKNRQSILESLDELYTVKNDGKLHISHYLPNDPTYKKNIQDLDTIKEEIRRVYIAIGLIDQGKAELCKINYEESQKKCSTFRARLILDDLKIHYANSLHSVALNMWRQKKIEEMGATLSGGRLKEFGDALRQLQKGAVIITENEFEEFVAHYENLWNDELCQKRTQVLEEQTIAKMRELGYSPAGMTNEGVVFFNTSDRDYRIMAKVNPENGQLSLRFVAVVGSEREKARRTTAQRRRDKEKARQWCAKSRELLKILEMESGIKFDELYRAEPDDTHNIMVIVDKTLEAEQAQIREGNLNAAH